MLSGLTVIFSFLFLGDFLQNLLDINIPGNVLGMVLLFAALVLRIVPLSVVENTSSFLLGSLGLFFVPPGAGIMVQFDSLKGVLIPFIISITLGTLLTQVFSGALFQYFLRKRGRTGDD